MWPWASSCFCFWKSKMWEAILAARSRVWKEWDFVSESKWSRAHYEHPTASICTIGPLYCRFNQLQIQYIWKKITENSKNQSLNLQHTEHYAKFIQMKWCTGIPCCTLYAKTMPFYIRDFSNRGLWYLWRGWPGTYPPWTTVITTMHGCPIWRSGSTINWISIHPLDSRKAAALLSPIPLLHHCRVGGNELLF